MLEHGSRTSEDQSIKNSQRDQLFKCWLESVAHMFEQEDWRRSVVQEFLNKKIGWDQLLRSVVQWCSEQCLRTCLKSSWLASTTWRIQISPRNSLETVIRNIKPLEQQVVNFVQRTGLRSVPQDQSATVSRTVMQGVRSSKNVFFKVIGWFNKSLGIVLILSFVDSC